MTNLNKKKKIFSFYILEKNSRRLKNKNIKILGNKPLVIITIDNLLKINNLFQDIVVSSDSEIIESMLDQKK